MALIIGTNQSKANTLYTLAPGDNFLLPANIVAYSTLLYAIDASYGGVSLTIDGTLIGYDVGVRMNSFGSNATNHLTIGATGVVAATNPEIGTAITSTGAETSIVNAGLVTGNVGILMVQDISHIGSTIFNSGRIISEDRSVDHGTAGQKLTLTNTGTITSYDSYSFDSDGLTAVDIIVNKGTMSGDVYLGGAGDTYEGNGGRVIGAVIGAAGNDILRGGAFVDNFYGGSGTDSITGRLGKDVLEGGGPEADNFYYFSVAEVSDTILDFTTADYLRFKSTAFGNATIGTCSSANFRSNTTGLAQDADDRFIYETDRDILWFDANGTGAGGLVLVTDFAYDVNLTRADIIIF